MKLWIYKLLKIYSKFFFCQKIMLKNLIPKNNIEIFETWHVKIGQENGFLKIIKNC